MNNEHSVTLLDIARHLGLSHSTISRALHDNPAISVNRRKQIQDAAQSMGYHPNPMATALGYQRHASGSHPIQAEIAWINCWKKPRELRGYKEFDLYWKGAHYAAQTYGYRLEEQLCNDKLDTARMEAILLARNVRGILIPPHRGASYPAGWESFHWERFCVVRLGYSALLPASHVVVGNHLRSGFLAYENMMRLGYTRIGFIYGHAPGGSQAGFLLKQKLNQKRGQQLLLLHFTKHSSHPQSLTDLRNWLKKYKPDALFTDVAEMRALLKRIGYTVPDDIGLATSSINDGKADAGIDQNSEEIGRAAVETLIAMINRNHWGLPKINHELLIESKWVDGTTLPARKR